MPTLATGISTINRQPHRSSLADRGFTLLELMVVVTIIGIFLGVAALSTDIVSFERKMAREVDRLSILLKFTAEDALLQGKDYGIQFYQDGFRMFLFDHTAQTWQSLDGDDVLGPRELDADMIFDLTVENREVELEPWSEIDWDAIEAATEDDDEIDAATKLSIKTPEPQVVVYSSGEITPFELTLRRESDIGDPGLLLTVEFDVSTEITQNEW